MSFPMQLHQILWKDASTSMVTGGGIDADGTKELDSRAPDGFVIG